MAYGNFVKTKGKKSGAYPGTTSQPQVEGVSEIKGETHSDVQSIEYRVHATIDAKTGRPTGSHTSEAVRVKMEIDQNYARYMASMIEGETLDVELVIIRNASTGSGGFEKAMVLTLEDATIADLRLITGNPGSESSQTSKTRSTHDTPELYEVAFSYSTLRGKAFSKMSNGETPWVDKWAAPGSAKG